jgi:hypothetical protein
MSNANTTNTEATPVKAGKLIVNRQSKWGVTGYVQRGNRKSNIGWVDVNHAKQEATIWNVEFVNKLK